ncbi:SRPBCC family protein [Nocardioides panacisoli]|uniref:SRPBCC family protein n=1 Tax=Nocardioides panacisoli TaxID=627624 RepID=UPI001C62CBE7|nr:SRPBCC family protein [Nocardioides panacisoli]QYJ05343.1 SRPBCC family protein [Nocardioides panacisoli]
MPDFASTHRITIVADQATVHALINDLRAWQRWSPWEDLDPDLQRTYRGPDAGVGARYEWSGNKKAGSGTMEITDSTPERIDIDLEFTAPFKARSKIVFDLRPSGTGTDVAWTHSGQRNPVMHVVGKLLFDKRVGQDFDRGLAQLKDVAEGR